MTTNTAKTTTTGSQFYSVFYTFPKTQNTGEVADLAIRINSATSELARYGLSGHVLFLQKFGHGFAVISREREFLDNLPNPLHAVFFRSSTEPWHEAAQ